MLCTHITGEMGDNGGKYVFLTQDAQVCKDWYARLTYPETNTQFLKILVKLEISLCRQVRSSNG